MSRLIVDQHGGSGGGIQSSGDPINGTGLDRHVLGQAPSELPGDHPVADQDIPTPGPVASAVPAISPPGT